MFELKVCLCHSCRGRTGDPMCSVWDEDCNAVPCYYCKQVKDICKDYVFQVDDEEED